MVESVGRRPTGRSSAEIGSADCSIGTPQPDATTEITEITEITSRLEPPTARDRFGEFTRRGTLGPHFELARRIASAIGTPGRTVTTVTTVTTVASGCREPRNEPCATPLAVGHPYFSPVHPHVLLHQ